MAQCVQMTIISRNKKLYVFSALLYCLLCAATVRADTQERPVETHRYASLHSGYRFITPDGPALAASPYVRLKSGVTGGVSAGALGSDLKLMIDGGFLHEDDYHAELFLDYSGMVRFHAASGAIWHNLLREQITPGTLVHRPLDQDMDYGVRTAITQADTRIKLGNNPFHLNLGYWELKREGFEQLRFSDHYWSDESYVITESSRSNRITREGTIGLDAHLGLFDLSYGFRIRDFSNQATAPRFTFANNADGALIPGSQAHDVIPDNRVTSHTIKLFSDLSGGLVASASYNLTQRENTGGHGEAVPSERPSDSLHSVAGDLSYTPSKRHSFALKYRHREIERNTPASLLYPFSRIPASPPGVYTAVPGELLVQPATSTAKDTLTFSATFRPTPKVIYRLEYNAELEARNNLRDATSPAGSPTALHSDNRQTHTGTAAFYWRPQNGIKLNASYSYAACDNPSYGASFSDRHTGKLLATYTANGKWGLTGSYIVQYESGEQQALTAPPAPVAAYALPRTNRTASGNANLWFSPADRLTVTVTYSYLDAGSDQSLLFSNLITDSDPLAVGNYRSSSHVYGVDAVYAVSEPLDISLAFQQVRSQARFAVPDRSFTLAGVTGTFTTAGITDLTRLDSTATDLSARADWRITALLGCSLDYSFRMYEAGQALYNGSVHSTMATLKARW